MDGNGNGGSISKEFWPWFIWFLPSWDQRFLLPSQLSPNPVKTQGSLGWTATCGNTLVIILGNPNPWDFLAESPKYAAGHWAPSQIKSQPELFVPWTTCHKSACHVRLCRAARWWKLLALSFHQHPLNPFVREKMMFLPWFSSIRFGTKRNSW